MNAELLKRLFRTIRETDDAGLTKLAGALIEDERRKGHSQLARQLDEILTRPASVRRSALTEPSPPTLTTLPTSKRGQEPLAQLVPPECLRHHMVLPPHVEARIRRVESEYAARERLARYGFSPRKRVLLYGPPGCGKSLSAERLAWTSGLPLLKVRFDSIMSSFFGESASNLRQCFETAREAPCLLFLDECDFVARSRTATNDVGEVPRIVNTLLQLLDDYDAPGLLVAATNLDEALDRAIFRRFDDVFEIPLPGPEERHELLRQTLSAVETASDIHWPGVVAALDGMSAANVVKVATDAAKAAILREDLPIRRAHIDTAVSEIRRPDP